ncbi:MAG: TIGR01777 family oxidoreductase [Planctomyces sp.]|nr:TIGR01777 family oxidoreductase [Planctomyces sp.]
MNILVGGASGLVGGRLLPLLRASGHTVRRLVRRASVAAEERTWNPDAGVIDPDALRDIDAVINLAGENIGEGRWSDAKKRRILDSRVKSTELLASAIAHAERRPECFISASAIGYYGDQGNEELTEQSRVGKGFLADVCRAWEEAAAPARNAEVRVVHLRLGMVLARDGGALAKMLLPFRMGVGGKIGSGQQYWSWVTAEEAARMFLFAATHRELLGAVNAVAPHPVTNAEFTRALGQALHRPTFLPMPAFAAKLALGEMADDLILSSARVLPRKLETVGYQFLNPEILGALRDVLRR